MKLRRQRKAWLIPQLYLLSGGTIFAFVGFGEANGTVEELCVQSCCYVKFHGSNPLVGGAFASGVAKCVVLGSSGEGKKKGGRAR